MGGWGGGHTEHIEESYEKTQTQKNGGFSRTYKNLHGCGEGPSERERRGVI